MSRWAFLRVWSQETTYPCVTALVEPTGIGVGVPRLAGRELTIAAQASGGADPVHPAPEAAQVTHPLGALEDMVTGPKAGSRSCLPGCPGCFRTASLLKGLWGGLLLLPLPNCARKMVPQFLQWMGRA